MRTLITAVQIPILVNDRPDVALAAGAAGTHLGPDDLPVQLARRIAPPGFLIGASVGSEVEAAAANDADYWGIGPWRTTATKGDAGPALGVAGFRRLVQLAGARDCIAIGSVTVDDVGSVAASGGQGSPWHREFWLHPTWKPPHAPMRQRSQLPSPHNALLRRTLLVMNSANCLQVFRVGPGKDMPTIRPRHEVEVADIGRIEGCLDTSAARGVHRSRR